MTLDTSSSVSVVVVTWNSARDIRRCLESLTRSACPFDKILVVDNRSTDNTAEIISLQFPAVVLIGLDRNAGFARANNIGIANTDSDWVLTLNPDAWIAEDYVSRLLEFAAAHPSAGTLGGTLLRVGTETAPVIDSTGIEIFRSRRVRDRGMGMPLGTGDTEVERVFGICAAAALYRREMIEDISIDNEFFPEAFFCYYEDVDVAWRAWRRGWEAWHIPNAVAWHRRGGSPSGGGYARFMTHRNRWWLIARNEPAQPLLLVPEVLAHECLMLLRLIRHPRLIRAVIRTLSGLKMAVAARAKLLNTNRMPPPFEPGLGVRAKLRRR